MCELVFDLYVEEVFDGFDVVGEVVEGEVLAGDVEEDGEGGDVDDGGGWGDEEEGEEKWI